MKKLNKRILLFLILMLCLASGLSYLGFNQISTTDTETETEEGREEQILAMDIALVNEDDGATFNGEELSFGDAFIRSMDKDESHEWYVVSRGVADNGLENNTYDMMIIVPNDFSEKALSMESESPEQVSLNYKINTSGNPRVQAEAEKTANEILNDVNRRIIDVYFASIVGSLQNAQDNIGSIVDKQAEHTNTYNNSVNDPLSSYTDRFSDVQDNTERSKESFSGLEEILESFGNSLNSHVDNQADTNQNYLSAMQEYMDLKEVNNNLSADISSQQNEFSNQINSGDVSQQLAALEEANQAMNDQLQQAEDDREIMDADAAAIQNKLNDTRDQIADLDMYLQDNFDLDMQSRIDDRLAGIFEDALDEEENDLSVLFDAADNHAHQNIQQQINQLPPIDIDEMHRLGLSGQTVTELENVMAVTEKYNQAFGYEPNYASDRRTLPQLVQGMKTELANNGVEVQDTVNLPEEIKESGSTFSLHVPESFQESGLTLTLNNEEINYEYNNGAITLPPLDEGELTVQLNLKLNNEEAEIDIFQPVTWGWEIDLASVKEEREEEEDEESDSPETASLFEPEEPLVATMSTKRTETDDNDESSEETEDNNESENDDADQPESDDDSSEETEEDASDPESPDSDDDSDQEESESGNEEEEDTDAGSDGTAEEEEEDQNEPEEDNTDENENEEETEEDGNNEEETEDDEGQEDEQEDQEKTETVHITNHQIQHQVDSSLTNDSTENLLNATADTVSDYQRLLALYENYFGISIRDNELADQELTDLAADDSLYNLFNNTEINGVLEDRMVNQLTDEITAEVQQPTEELQEQIETYNQMVGEVDENAEQLSEEMNQTVEQAEVTNYDIGETLNELAAWHEESMRLVDEQENTPTNSGDEDSAVMTMDNDLQTIFSETESLASQADTNLAAADDVYQIFDTIDEQASDIQQSGVTLVDEAAALSDNMTETVLEDQNYAENFAGVLENSRVGDRQNEDLYNFLSDPVGINNQGVIGTEEASNQKSENTTFTPYFLVLICSIVALFTAYVISTNNQKRMDKDQFAEDKSLVGKNLLTTILTASIGVVEGLVIGLTAGYLLGIGGERLFLWVGLITLIMPAMLLIATYLLRQLKMIGMFILLIILSLYLFLTDALTVSLSQMETVRMFSPLQHIETLIANVVNGTANSVLGLAILAGIALIGAAANLFVLHPKEREETEDEDAAEAN